MTVVGSPEVSVVLCSHNGALRLPGALASLRRQSIDSSRFEVIVVDDGSQDGTAAVATELGARAVVLDHNRGLAAARNAGVNAASAPIVAFTDDDCVCDETWLEFLVGPFEDTTVDAVGGLVRPEGPDSFNVRYLRRRNPLVPLGSVHLGSPSPRRRLARYLRGLVHGPCEMPVGHELYSVVGANMAFRRRLVCELGGFDEAFRFGSEEEELCRRAHGLRGAPRIVFEPRATVAHLFAPRLSDSLRRSRAYGRGNARMSAKHADVRPIVFPIPAAMVVIASVAIRAHRRRVAAATALIPLLAYPRWIIDMREVSAIEPAAYAYVQLVQEVLTMRGELEGRAAGYEPEPASQLA